MKKILLVVAAMSFCALGAQAKDGDFKKDHPRRAEVIHRENKEKAKINNAEKNGKITAGQEKKLDKEENHIRAQERADAKANGGHITKGEQRQLNHEERHVEHQGARMEKRDAAKKAAGTTGGTTPPPAGGTPVGGAPATPTGGQ